MRGFWEGSPFGIRRFKFYSPIPSKDVAMRRAASFSGLHASYLWRPYGFYKRRSAYMTMRESPQGMEASIGCAAGDGMGGGIFAKTAKTPPLQSGVCGDGIAIRIAPKGRPLVPPCAYHAHTASPHEPVVFTTMRHAASLRSSNNCKCLIEKFFIARGGEALSIKD